MSLYEVIEIIDSDALDIVDLQTPSEGNYSPLNHARLVEKYRIKKRSVRKMEEGE